MHKCPERQLRIMILEEDEETNPEGEFILVEAEDAREKEGVQGVAEAECNLLELPLYLVGGITGPKTLKLVGYIKLAPTIIMVDSGASYNFISIDLVHSLGLQVDKTTVFSVRLGDGRRKMSQGVCKGVTVQLAQTEVTADFHLFGLGGVDLILGVAWLETLGKVEVDWGSMTMAYHQQGRRIQIIGDPALCKTPISVKAFFKTAEVEFSGVLWVMATGS